MNRSVLAVALFAFSMSAFGQEDAHYQSLMKATGSTAGSLRKNLEAKNGDAAVADAKKLQETFTEVHDFWMKKKIDNATKFSTDAQSGFKEVESMAAAGKFDEASASLKKTMANCGGCHQAYREKGSDGSWKIKYQ